MRRGLGDEQYPPSDHDLIDESVLTARPRSTPMTTWFLITLMVVFLVAFWGAVAIVLARVT